MKENVRKQGILLPVSSIPSAYGIGTFGRESYRFVDFLEKSGNRLWQILPLGPTGYGDSPYQSFSTFAGNPYYIDLEILIEEGLLTKEICDGYDFGDNEHYVDYEKIYLSRFKVLKIAFENAKKQGLKDAPDATEFKNVRGQIDIDHVGFAYEGDHDVLQDVSLHIAPGETIAFVGSSGGGKTTLCNLIPRFYDVSEGRILLDGQDIKHFTLKSLRGNIGIVQQDVYLFSGTIYENIAYGRPGASKEDVINAAKRAGAHEFIMGLKDGYDTYVGERGVKLSGGQKQRISIARVFLKNPPIIILDEATSALDNESEFAVAKSLGELSEGRTTLTIAHRLSSIRNSDRILVLTDDGIVEEGNHDQLMEQKGIYYQFYETANALK